MGKGREGKFHPRKGKPSLEKAMETAGVTPVSSSTFQQRSEIADKYTVGEGEPAPNLNVRHRNRNTEKREDRQVVKTDQTKASIKKYAPTPALVNTVPEELPAVLSKEKLSELADFKSEHCISLFFPTHPAGAEVNGQVDQTTFKTMVKHMASALKKENLKGDVIDRMLKPAHDLLENDTFWRSLSRGLAVFIADGFFNYLRIPVAPKEELVMQRSFHLSTLLPVMTNSDHFFLLVLSKKQAKLYRADAFGMVYLPVSELPDGVDDVVHFEEKDDQKLFRTGSSGAGGGANYHGISSGKPDDKENIAMYFDEVDETLFKEVLHNEHAPLLLAGVEYMISIYKQVAKYKPIWDNALIGSHEHDDSNALYKMARKKMEPYFEERHRKALEMYGNNTGSPSMTSFFPEDVIPAAFYKRVWHLFVQHERHLWGKFDEMNNKLVFHATRQVGDEDLIDKAIVKTILNAGEVHLLPQDQMPGKSSIAALMRY